MGVHDREDARDANPLVNRLPAEVVSRRKPRAEPAFVEVEGGSVTIDRKTIFAMKPEHRAKWLFKALKHAAVGEVRANDVYDVIASNRFVEDLPPKVGRKMGRAVQEQMDLFSTKQRRFLTSEAVLVSKFGAQESAESKMEDMMARCRAFVREKAMERGDFAAQQGQAEAAVPPGGGVCASGEPGFHADKADISNAPVGTQAAGQKESSKDGRGDREKEGKAQQRSTKHRARSSSHSASSSRSRAARKSKRPARKRSRSRDPSSSDGFLAKRAATGRGRRRPQQQQQQQLQRRHGSLSPSGERPRKRRGRSSSSEPASKKRVSVKAKRKQR